MPRKNRIDESAKLTVVFRNRDSMYWDMPTPKDKMSLKDQDLKPNDVALASGFVPDLSALVMKDKGFLTKLGAMINGYSASQLRILIKVLHDGYRLKSVGLKLFQPVYWRSAPEAAKSDYLDQWFSCFVVSLARAKQGMPMVTLAASLVDMEKAVVTARRSSIKTAAEFARHKKKLVDGNKLTTPKRVPAQPVDVELKIGFGGRAARDWTSSPTKSKNLRYNDMRVPKRGEQ